MTGRSDRTFGGPAVSGIACDAAIRTHGFAGRPSEMTGRSDRTFGGTAVSLYDVRATMARMTGPPAGAAKIQIPRWIQLVGLPILLLFLWVVAGAARHVVFLFLVASLIAFLLNPIVRGLTRVWIPRGFGVAIVYLSFVIIVIAAAIALGTVVVNQTKSSASRVNDYFTVAHGRAHQTHADRDVDHFQHWLNTHRLGSIKIKKKGH